MQLPLWVPALRLPDVLPSHEAVAAVMPLEIYFGGHVLAYIVFNWALMYMAAALSDTRVTLVDGWVDWGRSSVGVSQISDCVLDISAMKTVEGTLEYHRVVGVKRAMPPRWCRPQAPKQQMDAAFKLEQLTEHMRNETRRLRLQALGAIEVNVDVHAVFFDDKLLLNPRVSGSGARSTCDVQVLGATLSVSRWARSSVSYETFFGKEVTTSLEPAEACLLLAF